MATNRSKEVTPRTTAAQLLQASQDTHAAWRAVVEQGIVLQGLPRGVPACSAASEDAVDLAAISVAGAIVFMSALSRKDKRFDFGVIRDALLEFLPLVVIGGPLVTSDKLATASRQLDLLAGEIMAIERRNAEAGSPCR